MAAGELVGLAGENGAGKTTLLKIVAGVVTPDAGDVQVAGSIGFATGEDRSLYFRLTGRQNLEFFGALHGLSAREVAGRVTELGEPLELAPLLERRVAELSSGMRARLGLARALLHRPDLLLLDEPCKSLDARHAEAVHALLREQAARGGAVLFVSHDRAELADLAARAFVLAGGALSQMEGVA